MLLTGVFSCFLSLHKFKIRCQCNQQINKLKILGFWCHVVEIFDILGHCTVTLCVFNCPFVLPSTISVSIFLAYLDC
jgi:hypothetical protein